MLANERNRKSKFVSRGFGSGDVHGSFQCAPVYSAVTNRARRAASAYAVGQNAETRRLRSITAQEYGTQPSAPVTSTCQIRMLRTREKLGLWPAFEKLDHGVDVVVRQLL